MTQVLLLNPDGTAMRARWAARARAHGGGHADWRRRDGDATPVRRGPWRSPCWAAGPADDGSFSACRCDASPPPPAPQIPGESDDESASSVARPFTYTPTLMDAGTTCAGLGLRLASREQCDALAVEKLPAPAQVYDWSTMYASTPAGCVALDNAAVAYGQERITGVFWGGEDDVPGAYYRPLCLVQSSSG